MRKDVIITQLLVVPPISSDNTSEGGVHHLDVIQALMLHLAHRLDSGASISLAIGVITPIILPLRRWSYTKNVLEKDLRAVQGRIGMITNEIRPPPSGFALKVNTEIMLF